MRPMLLPLKLLAFKRLLMRLRKLLAFRLFRMRLMLLPPRLLVFKRLLMLRLLLQRLHV